MLLGPKTGEPPEPQKKEKERRLRTALYFHKLRYHVMDTAIRMVGTIA